MALWNSLRANCIKHARDCQAQKLLLRFLRPSMLWYDVFA